MRRKIIVLFVIVMLFVPMNTLAVGRVVSVDTKFKQELLSAKETKAVQQLAKQLKKPMEDRQKRIILTYSGKWDEINVDFEKALLTVLLEDEYLAFDYRGYSYVTREENGKKIIDVTFQYYQTKNQHKYVQQQVKKIVQQRTTAGMTEHEKVKVLHDYIIENVTYDYSLNQGINAPYFALKSGATLCNGYAMLMYIMLKEAGVDARLVSGSAGIGSKTEYHAWNMVELDGAWYQLDVTWNDLDDGIVRYDYFLVSDKTLRADHSWKKGGLNGDEKSYPVAKTDYFEQLIQEQNKDVLTLFDLWRDPKTTASTVKQFEQLLTNSFNVLLDEFSLDYISRESYKVVADPKRYIDAAIAATGLDVKYTYEIVPYDYLKTSGVTIHVDVLQYSEDVKDLQLANDLHAGQQVQPKVTMIRSDGRKFDVTDYTTFTFDNVSLIYEVQGRLNARAAGVTEVTLQFDDETFERQVIINGESQLQQAAMKPYPVEGYKNINEGVTVAPHKQWNVTTSRVITSKARPIIRMFDEQGNDVFIHVRYANKKIIINAPTRGYEAGTTYRLFIWFEHYPAQNSSIQFDVAS